MSAPEPNEEVPVAPVDPPPGVLDYRAVVNSPLKLVTIASYATEFEAHLAAAKLEAGGVRYTLADENMVAVGGGLYTNLAGNIKLRVPAAEADHARSLLPQRRLGSPPCPKCASADVIEEMVSPDKRWLAILLLGLPWLFSRPHFRCTSCGHIWREEDDDEDEAVDEAESSNEDDDEEQDDDEDNDREATGGELTENEAKKDD